MDNWNFEQQFRNQWKMSLETAFAFALWCSYFVECELYDRTVCSVRKEDGTALPSNAHEFHLINAHAMTRRKELMQIMQYYSINQTDIKSAKMAAGRLSFKELQIEALRYEARRQDLEKDRSE